MPPFERVRRLLRFLGGFMIYMGVGIGRAIMTRAQRLRRRLCLRPCRPLRLRQCRARPFPRRRRLKERLQSRRAALIHRLRRLLPLRRRRKRRLRHPFRPLLALLLRLDRTLRLRSTRNRLVPIQLHLFLFWFT